MKLLTLCTALMILAAPAGAQNITGKLNCVCILKTSGCSFNLFHEAAGKPTWRWSQDFFYKSGTTPTAEQQTLACWRKRDVSKLGEGLCCRLNNDETDAPRYFSGTLE